MASWQNVARQAAQRHGVDPSIFVAQIRQESNGRDVTSPAGAQGPAQFMPSTGRGYGLNGATIHQLGPSLDAAARLMADNLRKYGNYKRALSAYNSGRPDAYQDPNFAHGQTYNYVRSIMGAAGNRTAAPTTAANRTPSPAAPAPTVTGGGTTTTRTTTTPGVDNSQLRRSLIAEFLGSGGVKSTQATQSLAAGWLSAQDVPGTSSTATTRTPGQAAADVAASHSPLVADASSGRGGGGAQAALGWAQSKVGFHETGTNSGGLASYLNQRFGMSNQPWCAMFTSAAVTKGGAPAIARTASVAEVRRQAMQGGGGYQKGFINPNRAKAGDLITFGNDHIAMVQRVAKGRVYYVGGNQSNAVTQASVPVGHGDIVRPLYGARHRA
jgi:hypothetical protein